MMLTEDLSKPKMAMIEIWFNYETVGDRQGLNQIEPSADIGGGDFFEEIVLMDV